MIGDDEMAQDYTQRDIKTNLALRPQPVSTGEGLPECLECGDAIPPARQEQGARYCVHCQSKIELHERLRAGARS